MKDITIFYKENGVVYSTTLDNYNSYIKDVNKCIKIEGIKEVNEAIEVLKWYKKNSYCYNNRDDVLIAYNSDDIYSDDVYFIRFYKSGYYMEALQVIEASSIEEAIIKATLNNNNYYSIEANEVTEDIENNERYIYLDRSEYHQSNIYLFIENARISSYKKKVLK